MTVVEELDPKTLDKAERTMLQKLLIILLKVFSTANQPYSVSACDRILTYLKKNPIIFEIFDPNPGLLKQLNFKRILSSTRSEVVYDLMVFIMRYYSDVDYAHYDLGPELVETLMKEEKKRIWLTLDHVLIKLDSFLEEFKNRNNLTAKALGEIFSYIEKIKNSVNDSKLNVSAQEGNNRSMMEYKSLDDIPGPADLQKMFADKAEKRELEHLKKELENLKENVRHSTAGGMDNNGSTRKLEDRFTEIPRAYLAEGVTTELSSLKNRVNKQQVSLEQLEKAVERLTDEKQSRLNTLENKVADDLESLRLLKDRVMIEVDLLKNRAGSLRNSDNLDVSRQMPAYERPQPVAQSLYKIESTEDKAIIQDHSEKIERLLKTQENFKKETAMALSKATNNMNMILKKLRLDPNSNAGTEKSDPSIAQNLNSNSNQKRDNQPSMAKVNKPAVKSNTKTIAERDDEEDLENVTFLNSNDLVKIEDKMSDQEAILKKMIFDQRREMAERLEILNANVEEMRKLSRLSLRQRVGER